VSRVKIFLNVPRVKYRDQIEYRILTLTRGTLLGWHVDI